MKKLSKSFYADESDWQALMAIKQKTGLPVSQLLRMAIKRLIDECKAETSGFSCSW